MPIVAGRVDGAPVCEQRKQHYRLAWARALLGSADEDAARRGRERAAAAPGPPGPRRGRDGGPAAAPAYGRSSGGRTLANRASRSTS